MRLINIFFKNSSFSFTFVHIAIAAFSLQAQAYYTVQETGDLLKPEQKQAAGELQFITSGDDGINFIGRFDTGFDDESNLRFEGGIGTTDFFLGAYLKWVPYPDFDKQPATGVTFGAQYGHLESENDVAVRAIPFVSKNFFSDHGSYSPYFSLPVAFSTYGEGNSLPIQAVLGSRYRHPDFEHCDFNFELGFDLNDSFSYVSLGAVFPVFE